MSHFFRVRLPLPDLELDPLEELLFPLELERLEEPLLDEDPTFPPDDVLRVLLGRYEEPLPDDELLRTRLEDDLRVEGLLTVADEELAFRPRLLLPTRLLVDERFVVCSEEDFRTRRVVIPGRSDDSELLATLVLSVLSIRTRLPVRGSSVPDGLDILLSPDTEEDTGA